MDKPDSHKKVLDLGHRKVSVMNNSDIMTLPKTFTNNYLKSTRKVHVTLSDGKLTITPVIQEK